MAKSFKREIKMEKAAFLESQGLTDIEIAKFLGFTHAGLTSLKQDPEYDSVRLRIKTGLLTGLQAELANEGGYLRSKLREMVPMALDNLFKLAQSSDERIKLSATDRILDRDGRLAQVSRIGLATEDQGGAGTSIDDDIATKLSEVLNAVKQKQQDEKVLSGETGTATIQ